MVKNITNTTFITSFPKIAHQHTTFSINILVLDTFNVTEKPNMSAVNILYIFI